MLGTQYLLADRERLFKKRLRLAVSAHVGIEDSQVIEADCRVRVLRALKTFCRIASTRW